MSSKPDSAPMGRWSIAARLIGLYTLAAAVLLASAMFVVHGALVRHNEGEDRGFLADKLRAIQADLSDVAADRARFAQKVIEWSGGEPVAYSVRVLGGRGEVLEETRQMSAHLPPRFFPLPGDSVKESHTDDGRWFLLATAHVEARSGEALIVQLAQDRSDDKAFMAHFRNLLIVVVVAGVLAAAAIASIVTKRGLRPLAEMTATVERIEASQLHERIGVQRWPVELSALAAAFDAMLRRLEDAFARLSQFSADLAHELRTPVFNLRGEAEVALSQARSADEYRDVLGSSLEELDRLSQMIDSLLFLARAEGPETHIERRPLDARREIEAVVEFHEAAAEERGLTVSVEGHGTVAADPIMFQRAVSNLLANAVQQTPKGGSIVIRLDGTAAQTSVSVADTGPGIAPEHLPRLFDRFFRADPARHASGSGLGLAIVKSIMDLHGGSAAVQSVVGKGSTFTLRFPARSAPA